MIQTKETKEKKFIPVRRSFLGELLVFWMCRRSLYRAFYAVHFRAAEQLPAPPSNLNVPVIFYANHNTWWDGYLAHIVMRQVYGLEPYLMMDVKQLRRYPFFSWAGCFSVDREDGREALRSIEYIAKELQGGTGRALWIFPQGEIRPQEQRPLNFYAGLGHLIRRVGECYVYPVATRFEFTREQFPEIFVEVGPVCHFSKETRPNPKQVSNELETTLTAQIDRLRDEISAEQLKDFVTIIKGKGSTDTLVDNLTGLFKFLRPKQRSLK
jgi:1-acyl-sn-glycerol-3-phosphate acyltransferase